MTLLSTQFLFLLIPFQFTMLSGRSPFLTTSRSREDSASSIIRRIKNGDFKMDGDVWKFISPAARSLAKGLLTVDPKKRLTLDDLFRSPWIHAPACRSHNNNVGCAITMTPISSTSSNSTLNMGNSLQFSSDGQPTFSGTVHTATTSPSSSSSGTTTTPSSSSHCIERHLKQTFNAFHTVTRDGGMTHLTDVSSTVKPATVAANGCACIPLPAVTTG